MIPSRQPNLCGLCGGTLVECQSLAHHGAVVLRCERCGEEPRVQAPSLAEALVYLERAGDFLVAHPLPSLSAPDAEVFNHQIGLACFKEALRFTREARA